jgi:hypothetical protein
LSLCACACVWMREKEYVEGNEDWYGRAIQKVV